MKKSSSLQLYPINFDPRQFKIGQSGIDKLPLKTAVRRHSASHVQLVKIRPNIQKSQIQLLSTQIKVLKRENQQLKKQLQISKNSSSFKTDKKNGYLQLIKEKMSSKIKSSRTTECQTGLFSSKEASMDGNQLTIADWYDNFKLANKLPSLADLKQLADSFFNKYCQNYSKIKAMFECLQSSQTDPEYKRLNELIDLYKVPLLYQRSPQMLFRELNKDKSSGKVKQKKEQTCWQVLSPPQTVIRFQSLLSKLTRSSKILRMLRDSEQAMKFIAKMQQLR